MSSTPIVFTPADLAELASFFEARSEIAQDASTKAAFASDRHHYAGSASAWRTAAHLVKEAIRQALPREKPSLSVVAGTAVQKARP